MFATSAYFGCKIRSEDGGKYQEMAVVVGFVEFTEWLQKLNRHDSHQKIACRR